MAVLGKRNKHLIFAQSILSLVLLLAFMILSMGNLISIPTQETDRMSVYAEDFYLTFQSTNDNELGDVVDVGFISLWDGVFHLVTPVTVLVSRGESLDELSATDIANGKEILFLIFLTVEPLLLALYEGIAFGALTLCLLMLPVFLFVCLIVGLIAFLVNRTKEPRKGYLITSRCLALGIGGILSLCVLLFFNPECTVGPMMPALFWTLVGSVLFFIVFSQVKHHSKNEREFLIFSQIFSLCSATACATMLWSAREVGFISTLYEQCTMMDGIEFFKYVWEGESDMGSVLAFLIITIGIAGLSTSILHLFQSLTRLSCLFNSTGKRANDYIFQYGICFMVALLIYLFLLTASKEYRITLSNEEMIFYVLSCVMAFTVIVLEVLYYILGYFIIRIDMTTKLEVLSGYAEGQMIMDTETLQAAINSPADDA